MLRWRLCSSVEGEKMLLWVISTWLFTLYQQIVFRDEWIQCKIYGVFLAWDPMGDKPSSLFYFVLVYFICFTWWIGFCLWKLLKRKSDVSFCSGFPQFKNLALWFLWISISHKRDEKGWCPGWLCPVTWGWQHRFCKTSVRENSVAPKQPHMLFFFWKLATQETH